MNPAFKLDGEVQSFGRPSIAFTPLYCYLNTTAIVYYSPPSPFVDSAIMMCSVQYCFLFSEDELELVDVIVLLVYEAKKKMDI